MSKDSTTNWRLDIWQDVFYDLKNKEILILDSFGVLQDYFKFAKNTKFFACFHLLFITFDILPKH